MARPVQISDDSIIAAARELFLEKGVNATTAEVAARAGVSEGSIFKRFPTKADLFRASVAPEVEEDVPWLSALPASAGTRTVQDNLVQYGSLMMEYARGFVPLAMMSWSNPGVRGLPDLLAGENTPPLRMLRAFEEYFRLELSLGRIRQVSPEIAARSFIGGCFHYVFTEVLLRAQGWSQLPLEQFIRAHAEVVWKGLDPVAGSRKDGRPL